MLDIVVLTPIEVDLTGMSFIQKTTKQPANAYILHSNKQYASAYITN